MCGFLAHFGTKSWQTFVEASETIRHRGPDGTELRDRTKDWSDASRHLFLAHHRLDIVGGPHASQPMRHGGLEILFNGEIYNYKQLKFELENNGYTFVLDSDTEVILKGYEFWGDSLFDRMRGMWAIAIFDKLKKEITLCRDRLGVKPLYYTFDDDTISTASEIKSLHQMQGNSIADYAQIQKFLIYGPQENEKLTLFRNIFRVLPGELIKFDCNANINMAQQKYFQFSRSEELNTVNRDDLLDALKIRVPDDLPVALGLSGGVDSSILYSCMRDLEVEFSSFTAVFKDSDDICEGRNAKINLDSKSISCHTEVLCEAPRYKDLISFIWSMDEPTDTLGPYAQRLVYQQISKEKFKISIDGQGADETYLGYPSHEAFILVRAICELKWRFLLKNIRHLFSLKNIKILLISTSPYLFEYLYFKRRARALHSKKLNFIRSDKPSYFDFKSWDKFIHQNLYCHLPVLLRYVDRNSMFYGIEARGPFLDTILISRSISCDLDFYYNKGYGKYGLRKLFDGSVNRKIIWNRKKNGFSVPQTQWLQVIINELRGYIDSHWLIERLSLRSLDEITDSSLQWRVVSLVLWCDVFNIKSVE